MPFTNLLNFSLWAMVIEFMGALLIIYYLCRALVLLVQTRNIALARFIVADGIITGLSFKLAGSLLKMIELQSWRQILMFAALFAFRTLLKLFLNWERERIRLRLPASG